MKSVKLLDEIIQYAEYKDHEERSKNKNLPKDGESWLVFNLKNLRELILEEVVE